MNMHVWGFELSLGTTLEETNEDRVCKFSAHLKNRKRDQSFPVKTGSNSVYCGGQSLSVMNPPQI
jgi:hypothetical protein